MAKDIVTKAEILGGEIDVRANFGQTVKVTVSPDPYMGDTEVTPSAETQVLQTKKKFVQDDITVYPAPTETLSTTSNGTFTPSDGKVGFYQVDVNVPQRFTLQTIADKSALKNLGEITISVPTLTSNMVNGWGFEILHLPDTVRFDGSFPFSDVVGMKYIDIPKAENLVGTFYGKRNFLGTYGDGDGVVKLKNVTRLDGASFYSCDNIHTVYFYKKATGINSSTFRGAGVRDIYVPWSEGEVAGAPWEANNATIHYDTVYDDDGNVVSST